MSGKSTTKLFVGNIKEDCRSSDLRPLFEKYGEVAECDVVKDFAFVHYHSADDAMAALEGLDGSEFQGLVLRVQLSHSKVRQKPGTSEREKEGCFRCGKEGHWAKDCRGPYKRSDAPARGDYGEVPYGGPPGRDFYPPGPPGGPPPPDRYHPYDRRPGPPPPGPGPRGPVYPHMDYAWPADYYARQPEHHEYFRSEDGHNQERDPPGTDELGRPPPEYYAHRLKEALFELVKDPTRIPPFLRDQMGQSMKSYSSADPY